MSTDAYSELRIRQALEDDAPILNRLAERAYTRYISRIGCRPAPMDDDYDQKIASGFVFVAESTDDGIAGLIVLVLRAHHLFIENVAVEPERQREGIGRALLAFAETFARGAGMATLRLYTNAVMVENLPFYLRLGYEETGRRTEDGFERVHFRKQLTLPKYDVAVVETMVLEVVAELHPEHLQVGALLMKVVGDLSDAREVSVGTQAIHRLKAAGLLVDQDDRLIEATDAGLRAAKVFA